ncbi:ABC transporter permease [Paraoerskovia marina]|uniref:Oligopeptide transport system permease protein n=1 Tax=Paraoerskovia marina TaxID=545619 RepID=A0A1H1UPP3_9CELL|nr:ABC transporter permease [Paraoerskovia marina]SDS74502.1 oligopeptide transport system permease protein [Paraoerskovia marina]
MPETPPTGPSTMSHGDQPRHDQVHFFADEDRVALLEVDVPDETSAPTSLWKDAWNQVKVRPLFWISAVMIVLVILVAIFPYWFTNTEPRQCDLANSYGGPEAGHPFGFDRQGCDIYARTIYGARASVIVGTLTTIGVTLIGSIIGGIAGFYGKWVDSILSRIGDVFFAIPLLLAAIVTMQVIDRNVWTVALVLTVFGWPQIARITRGAVLSVKNSEFVTASQALGLSKPAILAKHVMPNALAPIIVIATVSLGTFIVAEATLSYLGIGLPPTVVSWGGDISNAQAAIRTNAQVLFYPAGALGLTVLSFMMMGDVVRDALDPKARTR